MNRLPLLLIALLAGALAMTPPKKEKKLVKVWETDTTLRVPESALYNPKDGFIYVANIDGKPDGLDGSGFISRVTTEGKIENLKWVVGLNAPKGMGIHKNRLFVTDVFRLVAIDLATGQAIKHWDGVGEKPFLNDVTVDKDGVVYVSDNRNNKIYRLQDDKWEVWMEGDALNNPNGLLSMGKTLMVGSTKIGALRALNTETKTMQTIADGMAATDGIVPDGKKNFFVSDWNGQVFFVGQDGQKQQLLDTRPDKIHAADIDYIPGKKLVLVPTFYKNTLTAYRVD
ncbi:SMP-30/gluconolactonase/LRE family protein [Tellurirhabdus rosea]|uniref:SMP-30/gluconolactonase/LRE family protein n=1 Tax=Tellurirhabdus rosea TaxID=2674997 RepID=UPI00225AE855|nr:ATP-binding protein [Tellurirhabdus rosea]